MHIKIPWEFEPKDREIDPSTHCIHLLTNWYGLQDAGLNQFDYIKSGLLDRGFCQSAIDPCLFIRGSLVIVVHKDNVIIAAKNNLHIEKLLLSLKNGTNIDTGKKKPHLKSFDFTDNGDIKTFLGINIEKLENNQMYLS